MSRHYSHASREAEPLALTDIEVFRLTTYDTFRDADGEFFPPGWYWWSCFPGCLPDSDPIGPFDSESAAIQDAQAHGLPL